MYLAKIDFFSPVSNLMTHGTWQTNKASIVVIETRIKTLMVKTDTVHVSLKSFFSISN